MRLRARRDANHAAIADALRRCGWAVLDLSAVGGGVADLFAMHPASGRWTFVEVKRPKVAGKKRGRMQNATNERQAEFAARWPVAVIETVEQVAAL